MADGSVPDSSASTPTRADGSRRPGVPQTRPANPSPTPDENPRGPTANAWVRALLAYLPALAWAAFVLYVGSRSGVRTIDTDLPLDKVAHLALYGVLGLLAGIGWRRAGGRPAWVVPLVLAVAVGAADELMQTRVPTRSADPADWVADAIGALAGFGLAARRTSTSGRDRE